MPIVAYAGVAIAILYGVYAMILRAKADSVIASLVRKDRTKEAEEIGKLTQEVSDAKINYAKLRADHDASLPGGTNVPGSPNGRGSSN